MRTTYRSFLMIIFLFAAYFGFVPSAMADGKYPVRITQQSMIVYPTNQGTMQVVQVTVFKNNGKEKEKELPIYLPEGYKNLELNQGLAKDQMQTTEKGIVDKTGLKPGEEKVIILSYQMPAKTEAVRWEVEQAYVTETLYVVIPAGVLSFEANDLKTQSDLIEMNGRKFRRFTRVDLHPDVKWMVSFRVLDQQLSGGTKKADSVSEKENREHDEKFTSDGKRIYGHAHGAGIEKAVFSVSTIIVALTVAFVGLRREWAGSGPKSRQLERPWLLAEKENLLKQIGELEKDYRSQLISEEIYVNTKNKLRNQLVRIFLELRRGSMG